MAQMSHLPRISCNVSQNCAEKCKRRREGDLSSIIKDHTWKRFVRGLQRNGFFKGEIDGSKRYREKLKVAEVRCKDMNFVL